MVSSLIKLIVILVGGTFVIVVGFIFQRKAQKKKAEEMAMMQQNYGSGDSGKMDLNGSESELTEVQKSIKNYILNYKSNYSREQIKSALIQAGNSDSDVDEMLNKFL